MDDKDYTLGNFAKMLQQRFPNRRGFTRANLYFQWRAGLLKAKKDPTTRILIVSAEEAQRYIKELSKPYKERTR